MPAFRKDKGSFKNTQRFLRKMSKFEITGLLTKYAARGVSALESATPYESGLAARSWYAEVKVTPEYARITWLNSDVENGFPVAIMLQYGYATGTGGWVQGRDYINPAIRPIMDDISRAVWKVVTSA